VEDVDSVPWDITAQDEGRDDIKLRISRRYHNSRSPLFANRLLDQFRGFAGSRRPEILPGCIDLDVRFIKR